MNKKQLIIIWIVAFWVIVLLGLKKVSYSQKDWWGGAHTVLKHQYQLYGTNIDFLPIPSLLFEYNYRLITAIVFLLALFIFTVKNSNIKKETIIIIENEFLIIMELLSVYFLLRIYMSGNYYFDVIGILLFGIYFIRILLILLRKHRNKAGCND